ncbi:hypothetical protein KSB_66830 [Ktedonobacter robiniae]|uniref:Uncharacterized protein n=1 Tax=Ktedonobacter robiniae TaxID=2778365 RepID=A0ABQ3UZV4_9CHLR|nr:hypothetical protein KSB_66830 [Ktedonobacter robiniae]
MFFKRLLPEPGGYSFPTGMASHPAVNLLRIDIDNPEMKQFPEFVERDTGMVLRLIVTAFEKVREGGAGVT